MGAMDPQLSMATTQPLTTSASNSSISGSKGCVKVESASSDPFPAGLRVLVVDDDPICLLILDRMLRRCLYQVTTCGNATTALEMLRGNRDNFDLVISDVYMPDMDGFKLLELVGLEMDLPVIMMSANGETSAVMKGIKHGACDYLLKPVRIEELRNIWQHVVRKKWRASGQAVSHEDEKHKRGADEGADEGDNTSSVNEGVDGMWKQSKKRKDIKEEEEDADQDHDDPSTTKKPRVVWSVDLHQQFVTAVNQLGIDKAVPKRILELMNVHGLTRENVASHLQKYRLYLKRISGAVHQPGGLNPSFGGATDSNFGTLGAGGLGGLGDLHALAVTGQLSPQALSTLQAGLLGRLGPPNNLGIGVVEPLLLQIAALQGANSSALARPSYGQPVLGSQGNVQSGASDMQQITQVSQQLATFGPMAGPLDKGPVMSALKQQQQLTPAVGLGGLGQLVGGNSSAQGNPNCNAFMMQVLQQQAGSCVTSEGGLILPSGRILGHHGLSAELGAWASSPSNVNSTNASLCSGVAIQNAGSFRSAPASPLAATVSSSPNLLGSLRLGGSSCADSKGLHIPIAGELNPSVPSSVGVSSPLASTGLDSEVGATRMKNIGSTFGAMNEVSPHGLSKFGSNFTPLAGFKHGVGLSTGQRNQAGWQVFGSSQELVQVNSPVLSPRYSQTSSNSQGLNLGSGQEQGRQEQGQLRTLGFSMGVVSNLGMDGGRMKASVPNPLSQSEQSTVDSDLKLKEGSLGLLKAEHGWLSESLSDDLLNIFLKQQQEGAGMMEGELAAGDGYALDNMYVK